MHNANNGINSKLREGEGAGLSVNSKPTTFTLGEFCVCFLAMTLTYQVSMGGGLQLGNLEDIGLNMIALCLLSRLTTRKLVPERGKSLCIPQYLFYFYFCLYMVSFKT